MRPTTLIPSHRFGTGTSAKLLSENLCLPVKGFMSGPLGGDQQIGARIAEGEMDMLVRSSWRRPAHASLTRLDLLLGSPREPAS